MEHIEGLSQKSLEYYANKYLKNQEKENQYFLSTIEKDLIEELEDNKESILELPYSQNHHLQEYVDSNMSVYTYDQAMIYANNSELWSMSSGMGSETVEGQIVDVIYEHLCEVAWTWFNEQKKGEVSNE